jgi:hypothetical protein
MERRRGHDVHRSTYAGRWFSVVRFPSSVFLRAILGLIIAAFHPTRTSPLLEAAEPNTWLTRPDHPPGADGRHRNGCGFERASIADKKTENGKRKTENRKPCSRDHVDLSTNRSHQRTRSPSGGRPSWSQKGSGHAISPICEMRLAPMRASCSETKAARDSAAASPTD